MAVMDSLVSFAPFFVPVISGLVGGASLLLRDRREARSADHKYRKRLEKAQLEVQFITGWIQAKELVPADGPDPDPAPGRWLDDCYASVRRAQDDAGGHQRTGPVSLRRLLLLGEVAGPARSVRVAYWISLALFNLALAWWVNALVSGVPGFMHEEGVPESEEIGSYLLTAFVLFVVSAVLWLWTVRLGRAEPGQVYRKRIDSDAWEENERKRRAAARARAEAKEGAKAARGERDGPAG
ncbi:hypothetical protein ACFV0H_17010 [Streptomyces erythrochromogenes]|uniref:Uncharacterized protein n=1 Tax=Streptomyces erythrochromogenes TaxID=285574 RepID=A0ABZ1QJ06_9ACTN|nr:hypothetical protein [Streptomyces erythrochromogenes]MCX5588101.1 hypothetical protein [Streptomyces erythrochromogenes]